MLNARRIYQSFIVATIACLSVAATVSISHEGNAHCTLKAKYTGAFPEPTWIESTEECEGDCPSGGTCALQDTSDDTNTVHYECACPSGSGDEGCRARSKYARLSPNDPWVYQGIECIDESSCPDEKPSCDWFHLGGAPVPPPGAKWGTCKCQ